MEKADGSLITRKWKGVSDMRNFFMTLRMPDAAELSLSAVFTAIAAMFGKIPDYVTGWAKAKYFLKDWNSKTGLQGIIKKLMYFVMIGTAFLIGWGITEIGKDAGLNLGFVILIR